MHSGAHKSESFRSRNLSKCFICGDITDEEDDDQVPLHSNFDLRHSRPRRQGTAGTRRARSSSNDHHRRVASVPVHFLPRSCAGGVPQLPRSLPLVSVGPRIIGNEVSFGNSQNRLPQVRHFLAKMSPKVRLLYLHDASEAQFFRQVISSSENPHKFPKNA